MVRGFRVVGAGSERPIAQETCQLGVSTRAVEACTYLRLGHVDSTVRCRLDVVHAGAAGGGELADAVHAVVGVGAEDVAAAVREGKGLADELECARGVGGEHDGVAWGRTEEGEDGLPGLGRTRCGEA